jgi:hypothetical protein
VLYSMLAKGLSRKRVNNILACLGKVLRYAHEVELPEVVPRVKLLKIILATSNRPAHRTARRLRSPNSEVRAEGVPEHVRNSCGEEGFEPSPRQRSLPS